MAGPGSPKKIVYSKHYRVDIGDHVFPTSKYDRIRERLADERSSPPLRFVSPQPARDKDILLTHTAEYFDKLKTGRLTREEILRMELPYSRELVESSLICCGGTILASQIALEDGLGIHIGGGFHHAFPDHGEGFCVLNDIAVAIKLLKKRRIIRRALVIDCDLHQGNGTAATFAGNKEVFTFSIHQENNYPFIKPASSLDIGLHDMTGDKEYCGILSDTVPKIISDFKPQFIVYAAGADPFREDQIGGLALSKEGLKRRDEIIFTQAINYQVPIAVVLAGGYAYDQEDTVDIHCATILTGLKMFFENPVSQKPRIRKGNH
ncbi:MAG: histone deacetylase [Candidatus Omnitrophota bacterium]